MQTIDGFIGTEESNVIVRDFEPSADHGFSAQDVADYAAAVSSALIRQDDGSYYADLKLSGRVSVLPNDAGVRIKVESLNGALGNNVLQLVKAVVGELNELA